MIYHSDLPEASFLCCFWEKVLDPITYVPLYQLKAPPRVHMRNQIPLQQDVSRWQYDMDTHRLWLSSSFYNYCHFSIYSHIHVCNIITYLVSISPLNPLSKSPFKIESLISKYSVITRKSRKFTKPYLQHTSVVHTQHCTNRNIRYNIDCYRIYFMLNVSTYRDLYRPKSYTWPNPTRWPIEPTNRGWRSRAILTEPNYKWGEMYKRKVDLIHPLNDLRPNAHVTNHTRPATRILSEWYPVMHY